MVETGFPYSNDYLPDLNVLEEMLDKSPIKYIPQVPRYPCATHSSRVQSSARHSSLPPIHLGKDTSVTDADRRVPFKQGLEYYHALKARNVPVR